MVLVLMQIPEEGDFLWNCSSQEKQRIREGTKKKQVPPVVADALADPVSLVHCNDICYWWV